MSSDLPQLQTCPICGKELRGHRYALLASVVDNARDRSRVDKFLNDIKTRTWSEVLRLEEWQGDSDVILLYAIKCSSSILALILVRSPFELYDDDHVVWIETLTTEESSTLNAATERRNWKPLP
jgi:hypothetical protein